VASFALSGVVVSTFLNAVVFIIFVLSLHESFSALFFLLGTLTVYDASLTWISTILIGLCAGWFLTQTHALNVMTQGDLTAQSLGFNVRRLRSVYFVVASVLVAGSVTLAGMIGFVGLLVPHVLRMLIGPNHRVLVPASFLGGGILLVSLDAFARVIASPRELPVGIFTALCGAPFFLYLLYKKQGEVF
jgi:iron complex transport system permease protein